MYISGNMDTLVTRMHQLVETYPDLVSFEAEGATYISMSGFPLYPAQRILHNRGYGIVNYGFGTSFATVTGPEVFFTGVRLFT
jgi:hypothetical protein